jgi:hypothetical protein
MNQKRVFIVRTEGELNAIDVRISELGKSDMAAYIRSEIKKVGTKFNECPFCITPAEGDKKQKAFYISNDSYQILKQLSEKMKKPISSVFDELFIIPLLLPESI